MFTEKDLHLGRANLSISRQKEIVMIIAPTHHAIISLIAGILILIVPKLLNYIVAIYLIIIGLLGVFR